MIEAEDLLSTGILWDSSGAEISAANNELVYVTNRRSGGRGTKLEKATADGISTRAANVVGVLTSKGLVTAAPSVDVKCSDSSIPFPGDFVFLSSIYPGTVSSIPPVSSGNIVAPIGIVLDSTKFMNPNDLITITLQLQQHTHLA